MRSFSTCAIRLNDEVVGCIVIGQARNIKRPREDAPFRGLLLSEPAVAGRDVVILRTRASVHAYLYYMLEHHELLTVDHFNFIIAIGRIESLSLGANICHYGLQKSRAGFVAEPVFEDYSCVTDSGIKASSLRSPLFPVLITQYPVVCVTARSLKKTFWSA